MDEAKINLFDLLRRILLRWKFLLVCMLVGAVLVDGVSYARAVMQRQESEPDAQEETASLEELKEGLADRQIVEAEAFAEVYLTTMEHYEKDLAYVENSLKMQMDPNCVPTLTAQFFIDSSQQPETVIGDVIASYAVVASSEDVCEEILSKLGWDTEAAYIAELITVEGGSTVNSASTVNAGTDSTADSSVSLNMNDTNLMTVRVIAEAKEDCETMMDIIEQKLQKETSELQEIYGDFDLTLIQRQYTEKADAELIAYQESRISGLNTLRNTITNVTTNLLQEQLDYYFALIEEKVADLDENFTRGEIPGEEEISAEESAVALSTEVINIRYILLGLFLGLVVACAWILLRYILAPNLRVKDDLEEVYHFPILGSLPAGDKKGFLNKDDGDQYTPEERMEMICAGIRIAEEKEAMQSIYLTGTAGDEKSSQVIEQIRESLQNQGITVSSGRSVVCDPASLEAMTASDGVVFVERIDYSPYADLKKETEFCEMYHVPVMGAVVIE